MLFMIRTRKTKTDKTWRKPAGLNDIVRWGSLHKNLSRRNVDLDKAVERGVASKDCCTYFCTEPYLSSYMSVLVKLGGRGLQTSTEDFQLMKPVVNQMYLGRSGWKWKVVDTVTAVCACVRVRVLEWQIFTLLPQHSVMRGSRRSGTDERAATTSHEHANSLYLFINKITFISVHLFLFIFSHRC